MKSRYLILILLCLGNAAFSQSVEQVRKTVDSLNQLSFQAKGQPELRRNYAEEALKLATPIRYESGISDSYVRLGLFHRDKGDNDSALTFYHDALTLRRKLKLPDKIASVMDNIGNLYRDTRVLDSAMTYALASLKLREEIGNPKEMAKSYINVANLFDNVGIPKKGIPYAQRALTISRETEDTRAFIQSCISLSNLYLHLEQSDSSYYYNFAGIKLARERRDSSQLADLHNNLGTLFSNDGKFNESLAEYKESYKIEMLKGDSSEMGKTLNNIGLAFLNMRQPDSAAFYINRALTIGIAQKTRETEQLAYRYLSQACEQKGDWQGALNYFEQYEKLKSEGLDVNTQVANLEVDFDLAQKQKLISLLETEKRVKTIQLYALLGGLGLILVIVVLLWRALKQRKLLIKRNEEIYLQEVKRKEEIHLLEIKRKEEILLQEIKDLIHKANQDWFEAWAQGQAENQKKLAQELHDRVAGMLIATKFEFDNLDKKLKNGQINIENWMKTIAKMMDEAVAEVRRISRNLDSGAVVDFGLIPSLQNLSDSISGAGKIQMKILSSIQEEAFPMKLEVAIYKIVHQLIINILDHAEATEITVQLTQREKTLNIMVEDNGKGFDLEWARNNKGGMGLTGIERRVDEFGGTVIFDSAPGEGTIVVIDLPLPD